MVNGYDTRVRKLVQHFEAMDIPAAEVAPRDQGREEGVPILELDDLDCEVPVVEETLGGILSQSSLAETDEMTCKEHPPPVIKTAFKKWVARVKARKVLSDFLLVRNGALQRYYLGRPLILIPSVVVVLSFCYYFLLLPRPIR